MGSGCWVNGIASVNVTKVKYNYDNAGNINKEIQNQC